MPAQHAARRGRLAALVSGMPAAPDAVLVTGLINVRYLTGFTGSNAALLVDADGGARLGTDFRYAEQCAREVPDLPVLVERRCALSLAEHAAAAGRVRLGFEAHQMSVADHSELTVAVPAAELVAVGHAVEDLRRVCLLYTSDAADE